MLSYCLFVVYICVEQKQDILHGLVVVAEGKEARIRKAIREGRLVRLDVVDPRGLIGRVRGWSCRDRADRLVVEGARGRNAALFDGGRSAAELGCSTSLVLLWE